MSLELRGVTKDFTGTDGRKHRAVDDLSLVVEDGSFCTLLGPSGCGKTTLLRLIAGFEHPTAGTIVHDGRSLSGVPPYRRGFPMVFQSYALVPHMSVLDNVAYGLRVRGVQRDELQARAMRALDLLGLELHRDRHPAQLSGGQQQRVALARCLVLEPAIILLDEPLSNLDAELRVSMRSEIRALQQRLGITAIYVTHDQEEALAVSDRVVVMNAGRIEQTGTAADVYQRPATEFVARFMGNATVIDATPEGEGVMLLGERYDVRPDGTRAVVRSDAVAITENGGRHRGRIVQATFLGRDVRYVVETSDGVRITAEESAAAGANPRKTDDPVMFTILADHVHFIA
ncbi:MAG: ABC transporter ATP-binding protein [Longimicrobiales bacterium]